MSAAHGVINEVPVADDPSLPGTWSTTKIRPIIRDLPELPLAIGLIDGGNVMALAEVEPLYALLFAEHLITAARQRLIGERLAPV
jgi:hypothetical protein